MCRRELFFVVELDSTSGRMGEDPDPDSLREPLSGSPRLLLPAATLDVLFDASARSPELSAQVLVLCPGIFWTLLMLE